MQKPRTRILSLAVLLVCLFCWQNVSAQQKTITGTVTDSQGETLIGVSISVKGTTTGTITDIDGKYSLSVPGTAKTLEVKYIGMKTSEHAITGSVVDIVMQDSPSNLEEVVVIGYGTVQRKDLIGSVSSIKAEEIATVPVVNVAEAMTGKLAGVQITTTEGSPDAELMIRVRGGGSITGNNTPLFIVDGFPVQSISDIAAGDIESIDVLKDAFTTAIYGSRGANGVVLVTTKSGKAGRTSVNYNAYYGWKKNAKTLDVLSPKDYALWQYELTSLTQSADNMKKYTDYFGAYQDIDLYDNVPHNDWQDQTFGRTGHTFNHNLSISGGNDLIRYAFSYTHVNDKAIMIGSNYKRDNFTLKLNTNPLKTVGIDFSARYSDTDIRGGGTNDANSPYDSDKRLKYAVIYPSIPLSNLTAESGSSDDELGNLYNPIVSFADNDRKQQRKSLNMTGAINWEVFENFSLKTELGLDNNDDEDMRFWGVTTYYIKNEPLSENQGKPAAQFKNTSRQSFRNTNTVNYDFKKLLNNENHNLNLMVGHEYIITKEKVLTNIAHGFPTSFTASDAWKYSTEGSAYSIDNRYSFEDKLLSFFARANYDFQSKYLLSATFRADGSSKFGDGNRWGYFPSAAVAWRVSSESFMENSKSWLDDLKLRLSFGTVGNNNINVGQMLGEQPYESKTTSWINGFGNIWIPSKTMVNPDLKWETTVTRNLGIDFTTLGGKLNGSIDGYVNTTKDLLINFPVSGSGYDTQFRNMGKTQNKGIEVTVNWIAIDEKDYGLSLSANIAFNKNKIKSLGIMNDFGAESYWASTEIGYDYMVAVGGSVGKMYGYRSDGRYELIDFEGYNNNEKKWEPKKEVVDSSPATGAAVRPGSMKLKNLNDDNVVTVADREIIGDANPKHTGGFTINGRLYGFDLSASFNWSYGNDIYNANKVEFTQSGKYLYRSMISDMAGGKRWTNLRPDGTISNDATELAAMNANTSMWSPHTGKMVFSDWAVEDGSFLRLNTLTLGYTLPKSLVSKAYLQSLRFYVTVHNVFCLTSYSGYDPEVSTMRRTPLTPGVDYSAYPKSRQFIIGANLNF